MGGAMIKWHGLNEFLAEIKAYPTLAAQAMAPPMKETAEIVMTKSKRVTPVDTGTLRASGFVADPEIRGTRVEVEMGYGGAASDYALIVHESPPRNWSVEGTGPKYLEQPFDELANKVFVRRVRKHVEEALR